MHILGAPGQGKSKFLELLAQWNIGREAMMFVDSTEGGKTATNILKHCILKGWDKVCIIDPSDFETFNAVPILKPLKLLIPHDISTNNISDVMRVLWERDWTITTRVERYVPAVLHALWEAKLTLAELPFLLDQPFYKQRQEILDKFENDHDSDRMTLLAAYRDNQYNNHFLPSVNTLNPLTQRHIKLLIGSQRKGIPWSDFIKEKYVVIVNLNPKGAWGTDLKSRKLLGTLILSELIHALGRMVDHGWKAPVSIFIDEVGHYATPNLANILSHQRHLNLRLTMAHQNFGQIKLKEVHEAIMTSAQNKVLFKTDNHGDRLLMMQVMGYGAELADRMVLFNLAQLEKQKASIRLSGEHPQYVRIKHIDDPEVTAADLKAFKERIYKASWYASPEEINHEINARFPKEQYAPTPLRKSDPKPKRTSGASTHVANQSSKKAHRRPAAPSVPDNGADSAAVLQPQERRPALEIPWDNTPAKDVSSGTRGRISPKTSVWDD